MKLVPWMVALAAVVVAATVTGYTLTAPANPFAGVAPVPEFDYTNTYPDDVGISVECHAYTNETGRDFNEPPDRTWVGVRYIRDCVIRAPSR